MEAQKFIIKNDYTASGENSVNVLHIINPYNNEIVRTVNKTNPEDINESLNYLTSVFSKYKRLPAYTRSELLEKVAHKLKERKEELAGLLTNETGKPIKLSKIELDRAIFTFRTGAEEARRIEGEIIPLDQLKGSENKQGYIRRFPIGLILGITPWNFPVNLVAHKLAPALASGNVVLLKPASASLCCGIEIAGIILESCRELGLDYTPVNVITSSGGEIEDFLSDDRIKMISFTGSPLVGWGIKKKLSRQKLSLELGGNAGVIVDSSADINSAVSKIAIGAFAHAGQSCISVQRVFVHSSIYKEFQVKLLDEVSRIKYGNPFEEDTLVGPMINETEAKRAERWIHESLENGGRILTGGGRKGAVLEPTILEDIAPDCNVNSKEVFAPVMTLRMFDDFRKAVEELDDSDFGLQAGVFTSNLQNAFYAFENIEAGGIVINDVPTYRMDSMPYGGVKHSGTGKEGIKYAIEEMTERKILII